MGNAENSRFFLTKNNSCGNILCDHRWPVRVLRTPPASCKYPSSAIPFSPTTSKLFKKTNRRNSRPLNIFRTLCASPPKSSPTTCLSRFLSNSSQHFRRSFTISFRFILFRTLLPPAKLHLAHFQPLPNSLPKTPGGGVHLAAVSFRALYAIARGLLWISAARPFTFDVHPDHARDPLFSRHSFTRAAKVTHRSSLFFALFCTFLHFFLQHAKSHPVSFQPFAQAVQKNTRGGGGGF